MVTDPHVSRWGHARVQRYYRPNMAALTFRELWRQGGGKLGSQLAIALIGFPLVAVCKLFHLRFPMGERFPLEIGLEWVDGAFWVQSDPRIRDVIAALREFGFGFQGAFNVLHAPFHSLVFALMNPGQGAYACVYRLNTPIGTVVYADLVTQFAGGGSLTTTHRPDAVAMEPPPGKHRLLVPDAPPAQLWEAHQAEVARLGPQAGGAQPVGTAEELQYHFCRAWREFIEFQAGRGVFVPVEG